MQKQIRKYIQRIVNKQGIEITEDLLKSVKYHTILNNKGNDFCMITTHNILVEFYSMFGLSGEGNQITHEEEVSFDKIFMNYENTYKPKTN